MTYRKRFATERTMKFKLQSLAVTGLASMVLAGCSSPASKASPESVRDPLGIDRAVNDYYFPNGVPAANGDSESAAADTDADGAADSSAMDDLP
ncbi:hypothetical protein RBSWK_03144 [Rhodopirellula baltica SWK14]|uniref:Secreted protein n=1 Tax=Rhodopirellula baltica SWK14 TaxID=993516 RepID=L7CFX2_RHOBT|nr:hypothetical protein RBSWK_03144 [Rhodopirellula baltica SWK14]